jgi:hypothetical protein
VSLNLGCGVVNEGLYIAASHFKLFYEREEFMSFNSFAFAGKRWSDKKQIDKIRFMPQFGLLLRLADWTQIRYVQTAPLSALKDPDLHNWSVKGKTTPSGAPPVGTLPITQIRPSVR